MAAELEIIKKRGAFYSYQDLKLGQGRDKSIEFLNTNPELCDEIEEKIREFAKDTDSPILQFAGGEDDDDDDDDDDEMDFKSPITTISSRDLEEDDDDEDDEY